MTGLVLKLGPRERILINGAVIENGDRRSRINIITPNANILRLRDAIHPSDAKTPAKRLCYVAQLALSGDICKEEAQISMVDLINHYREGFRSPEEVEILAYALTLVKDKEFYQALKVLKKLCISEG
ncbi:MAG: flagellar biosynthesis repressor FlbT [Mangrovicoccus sp.]